jgi:hypothetical protein
MSTTKKIFRITAGLLFALLFTGSGVYGATRTWTGAVNSDFNNGSNYSPSGPLLATDDLVFNLTGTTTTITLSASITINNLTFNVNNGNGTATLNMGTSVLTVNGTASFDAIGFSNPTHYDLLYVDVMSSPAGAVFNGAVTFHNTGSGITYLQGTSANPGYLKCKANVTLGSNCRTQPAIEPDWIFDAPVSQTITCNNTYYVMGEDLDFGQSNSPTVTFAGATANQARTYSYDGNIRINNTTTVQCNNASLDRYVAGGGTFFMNAGSRIEVNYSNSFPGYNAGNVYSTYTLTSTSTQIFLGAATTQNIPGLTYGNLIAGGTGNKTATGACIVQNDFTVNSGSTYLGSTYTHQLYGNFNNNGTFTANTCTWILNGTGTQNIQGSVSSTFYNLTVNKSSGNAYLQINTTVGTSAAAGVMNFQAGPLYLNSRTLTIANNATTAVIRTSGYAISENNVAVNPSIMKWQMGTTTGAHIFPFGVATGAYIPVTFNKTTGTAADISIATRATTVTNNTPWAGASNVAAVANMYDATIGGDGSIPAVIDRWWDITASAAVTANVTFSYQGSENTLSAPYNTGNLGAQHWNGTSWDAPVGSAVAVTSGVGSVTASGISTFSPWVLASVTAPLPVEFTSVSGTCSSGNVLVTWQTASELNNDFFTVEKSTDGITFVPAGTVNGAGTSTQTHVYSFADPEKISATTYYSIQQTDFNGHSARSSVAVVDPCGDNSDHFTVFAEGADVNVIANVSSPGDYTVVIYDAQGRVVSSSVFHADEGAAVYRVNGAVAADGIYLVGVFGPGSQPYRTKLLIRN